MGTTTSRGSGPNHEPLGELVALDALTGAERWSSGELIAVNAPAVVDDESRVIVSAGYTRAFDLATGTLLWENERWAYDYSIADGVVAGVQSYGDGAAFALDTATGNEIWTDGWCDCGFGVGQREGELLWTGPSMIGRDPRSGTVNWGFATDGQQPDGLLAPASIGRLVFVGAPGLGTLFAIEPR